METETIFTLLGRPTVNVTEWMRMKLPLLAGLCPGTVCLDQGIVGLSTPVSSGHPIETTSGQIKRAGTSKWATIWVTDCLESHTHTEKHVWSLVQKNHALTGDAEGFGLVGEVTTIRGHLQHETGCF